MSYPNSEAQPAILRLEDLIKYIGLGRSAVYKLGKTDPTFPKRVQLSDRAVGWRRSEIDEWVANLETI